VDDIVGITRHLTIERVVEAYASGVFPMAVPEAKVVTWHHPDPRAVIPLDAFHLPRRLARTMRQGRLEITYDRAFPEVMRGCAAGRPVWIGPEFHRVYGELHRRGQAHSVEVWQEGALVGGLYVTDASKVAVAGLVQRLNERGFLLLEVQYLTEHLAQFGAHEVSDHEYQRRLRRALAVSCTFA
jgi:leucyl/phenylalanyl-tRNA--protein transferase